jgi:hypothetical protein
MVFRASFVAMKNACCAANATPTPVIDYEKAVRCTPTGETVLVITAIDPATGVPTSAFYNIDGSAFTGTVADLGACDTPDVESDPVAMCDGGTQPFLRWFIKRDGVIIGAADTSIAGLPYSPVGVTTIGACSAATQKNINHEALNFANGTAVVYDPDGNGATWTYTGTGKLQSVTVTVLKAGLPNSGNTVRVTQGSSSSKLYLADKQSKTWSVSQDNANTNEVMTPNFTVDCLGDSACTIAWTEEL